jgi:hypothetical protein
VFAKTQDQIPLLGIIKKKEGRITGPEEQVLELKAIIARLQKYSSNSSKLPSLDIGAVLKTSVFKQQLLKNNKKPRPVAKKGKDDKRRKIGGQKRYKKHEHVYSPRSRLTGS